MELMRQQAKNFGTRIVTDDIVSVDFSRRPLVLNPSAGKPIEAQAVIVATGARANYLGLPSEEAFKNRGVSACAVCDGALPRFRNRELVVIGGGDSAVEEADVPDQVRQLRADRPSPRPAPGMQDHGRAGPREPQDRNGLEPRARGSARRRQAGVTGVRRGQHRRQGAKS